MKDLIKSVFSNKDTQLPPGVEGPIRLAAAYKPTVEEMMEEMERHGIPRVSKFAGIPGLGIRPYWTCTLDMSVTLQGTAVTVSAGWGSGEKITTFEGAIRQCYERMHETLKQMGKN